MKPGTIGLVLFALGSLALLVFSPLYSPDLAVMPPGPVNSRGFTIAYYAPRIVLSAILISASVIVVFTDSISKLDKYFAYGVIAAVLGSWRFWLAS